MVIYGVAAYIFAILPETNDLATGFGKAILMPLIVALLATCFIVPYVQSIIVLFFNAIDCLKGKEQN